MALQPTGFPSVLPEQRGLWECWSEAEEKKERAAPKAKAEAEESERTQVQEAFLNLQPGKAFAVLQGTCALKVPQGCRVGGALLLPRSGAGAS